jgi:L-fucose dehydrogenase
MDLQLHDKVALVTGGASGIGEGIVRQLAAEGAHVFIGDRNSDRAGLIVNELRGKKLRCDFVPVELTDEEQIVSATATVVHLGGCLDVLINNAGVNDGASIQAGTKAFRASLERNLTQVYACVHHALPHLKASRGNIVNIGSKVAETGQGGSNGYAASKGGINALTREWAVELAPYGIRVNTVIPAEAWTPLYERWLADTCDDPKAARAEIESTVPFQQRMTTCQELADMTVFLASQRSSHTTGQIIHVDGGYTHLDRACTLRCERT